MRVDNPFSLWLDQHGDLLDAGYIYVGTASSDPEVSPLQVYWDAAFTLPAVQPLRTRGGKVVNSSAPALFFVNAADYSFRSRDADGNQVDYVASTALSASTYQPLDADLTTIAAQANQSFGMGLLTAATAAAAKAMLAIGNYLASVGGTVTGNIVRSGAGPHLYHTDGTFVSGRVYVTAPGAADPTSQDGDIWIEAA
jgi:hypothetical protein